jgi:hypothetical protein
MPKKTKFGKMTDDDKINYFTATFEPLTLPVFETEVKSKTLEYIDNIFMATEAIKFADQTLSRTHGEHVYLDVTHEPEGGRLAWTTDPHPPRPLAAATVHTTPASLRNRFPRFCSCLNLTDKDIASATLRSDRWVVRLMEQIFDDANEECR